MDVILQRTNEQLANEIIQRRALNGRRLEAGTFVAIAEGRVVGVANSYAEADAQLVQAGTKLGEGMICEVADASVDVIRCEFPPCP